MVRLLIAVLLAGCVTQAMQMDAVRVRALNPQPLVVTRPGLSVALEIVNGVPDQFVIPESNGITPVPVESWHASLTNAFHNSFPPPGAADPNTVHVQITAARLDFIVAGQHVRDGVALTGAAKARIRFAVQFVDAGGGYLDAMTGEAVSTATWTNAGGSSQTAAEVIEQMVTQISERLAKLPQSHRSTARK